MLQTGGEEMPLNKMENRLSQLVYDALMAQWHTEIEKSENLHFPII